MNTTEFAKLKNCKRAAVLRALKQGLIPRGAWKWTGKGRGRRVEIVDPKLAASSWEPRAPTPSAPTSDVAEPQPKLGPLNDSASAAEARRVYEIARARREVLELQRETKELVPIEVIKTDVATCIIRARSAFLQIGWKAMSKLNLTRDQACDIETLAREILTELAESTGRVIAKATAKPGREASS